MVRSSRRSYFKSSRNCVKLLNYGTVTIRNSRLITSVATDIGKTEFSGWLPTCLAKAARNYLRYTTAACVSQFFTLTTVPVVGDPAGVMGSKGTVAEKKLNLLVGRFMRTAVQCRRLPAETTLSMMLLLHPVLHISVDCTSAFLSFRAIGHSHPGRSFYTAICQRALAPLRYARP